MKETSRLLPNVRHLNVNHPITETRYHCCKVRMLKSKLVLVVLFWNFLNSLAIISTSYSADQFSSWVTKNNLAYSNLIFSGFMALVLVTYPAIGYLIDVHIGRYKTAVIASIALTIGMLIGVIRSALDVSGISNNDINPTTALLSLLTFLITSFAFMLTRPVLLLFGIDHLKDACSEELSSFVYWFVWIDAFGKGTREAIVISGEHIESDTKINISVLVVCIALSLSIWIFLFLNHRYLSPSYHIEPRSSVPFKQTFQVLKFAATHKYPVKRSALTYCEDGRISRMDLGKTRYGGPFSTEQVENVKVTLRVLLIIVICCISSLPYQSTDLYVMIAFRIRMRWTATEQVHNMAYTFANCFVVPIHEFLIFPLLRKYYPSILKRLGFTMAVLIVSTLGFVVIDNWPAPNSLNVCMFQEMNTSNQTAPSISENSMVVFEFLMTVGNTLYMCTLFEFTIAQSPENFKSILVGLTYALYGIQLMLLQSISLPFMWFYTSHPSQDYEKFNCASIFFLVLIGLGTAGLVLYVLVAGKYVYRLRDDVTVNEHMYAEEYYSNIPQNTT